MLTVSELPNQGMHPTKPMCPYTPEQFGDTFIFAIARLIHDKTDWLVWFKDCFLIKIRNNTQHHSSRRDAAFVSDSARL